MREAREFLRVLLGLFWSSYILRKMLKSLSPSEIRYIHDGLSQNIRNDGRRLLDYRPMRLETGVISQTNGSCRLVLDTTDILVGIKAEIGDVDPQHPDSGRIQVSVECCPSASPEFEGRGAEVLNVELARVIEQMLKSPSSLDLKPLCLIPGKTCWILYIDAMVLDSGGNLFDAISVAVRAALTTTTIPNVNVVHHASGEFELELSDDAEESVGIKADNIPVCVTFTRIGNFEIIDTTLAEELCGGSRITLAVNKAEQICTIQKGNGLLQLDSMKNIILMTKRFGTHLISKMDEALREESASGGSRKVGFFD